MTFTEEFPTGVVSFPGTDPNYSEWTNSSVADVGPGADPSITEVVGFTSNLTANVTDGRLQFVGTENFQRNLSTFSTPTFTHITLTAIVAATEIDFAFTSPGVVLGNVGFRTHPGFSGGAFVTESFISGIHPDVGFTQNMGFTPAVGDLQRYEINATRGSTRTTFDVRIDVGTNSFTDSFVYTNGDVGPLNRFGFYMVNSGTGSFDNLNVTGTVVPEPSPFALLGLGMLGLVAAAQRWRRAVRSRNSEC